MFRVAELTRSRSIGAVTFGLMLALVSACGSKSSVKSSDPQPLSSGMECEIVDEKVLACSQGGAKSFEVNVPTGCTLEETNEGIVLECVEDSVNLDDCTIVDKGNGTAEISCPINGSIKKATVKTTPTHHNDNNNNPPPAQTVLSLTAQNRINGGQYGQAMDFEDDILAVGSPAFPGSSGSVEVFQKNGNSFERIAVLKAPSPTINDRFGFSVAIDGDYIAVGSPGYADDLGAVYVYQKQANLNDRYTFVAQSLGNYPSGEYGYDVALDNRILVVGQPGYAIDAGAFYVYQINYNSGTFVTTIDVLSIFGTPAFATNDRFGTSVAIDDTRIVVGAPQTDVALATDVGSALVFDMPGAFAVYRTTLTPAAAPNSLFGYSVDVDGNDIVVGAPAGNNWSGDVYMYASTDNGVTWAQVGWFASSSLTQDPTDGALNDRFGASVAIEGRRVVVGAPGVNNGVGRAYLFEKTVPALNKWNFDRAQNAGTSDRGFGTSLFVDDAMFMVGSPEADAKGAVRVYFK